MADTLKVAAPMVQLRTKTGAYVHLMDGAPVPEHADPEHVGQLLESEMLVKVEATDPEPEPDGGGRSTSVKDILEQVDGDPEKAQAALDAEVEARGGKARKTLVAALQEILEAAD